MFSLSSKQKIEVLWLSRAIMIYWWIVLLFVLFAVKVWVVSSFLVLSGYFVVFALFWWRTGIALVRLEEESKPKLNGCCCCEEKDEGGCDE